MEGYFRENGRSQSARNDSCPCHRIAPPKPAKKLIVSLNTFVYNIFIEFSDGVPFNDEYQKFPIIEPMEHNAQIISGLISFLKANNRKPVGQISIPFPAEKVAITAIRTANEKVNSTALLFIENSLLVNK